MLKWEDVETMIQGIKNPAIAKGTGSRDKNDHNSYTDFYSEISKYFDNFSWLKHYVIIGLYKLFHFAPVQNNKSNQKKLILIRYL